LAEPGYHDNAAGTRVKQDQFQDSGYYGYYGYYCYCSYYGYCGYFGYFNEINVRINVKQDRYRPVSRLL
jgi:hypothetical protein